MSMGSNVKRVLLAVATALLAIVVVMALTVPAMGTPPSTVPSTSTTTTVPVDYCDPANQPAGSIGNWLKGLGVTGADCFSWNIHQGCGSVDVVLEKWPHFNVGPYVPVYLIGDDVTPDLPAFTFPAVFAEDEGGGSVTISWFLVGPEKDYLVGSGIPNFWDKNQATITVDTDCEDEPTTTTTLIVDDSTTTTVDVGAGESSTTTTIDDDTTSTTAVVEDDSVTTSTVAVDPDDEDEDSSTATTDPDDPDELPFTGINMGAMGAAGASGVLLGLLILLATRGKAVE